MAEESSFATALSNTLTTGSTKSMKAILLLLLPSFLCQCAIDAYENKDERFVHISILESSATETTTVESGKFSTVKVAKDQISGPNKLLQKWTIQQAAADVVSAGTNISQKSVE